MGRGRSPRTRPRVRACLSRGSSSGCSASPVRAGRAEHELMTGQPASPGTTKEPPAPAVSVGTTKSAVGRTVASNWAGVLGNFLISFLAFPAIVHGVGVRDYGAWAAVSSLFALGAL